MKKQSRLKKVRTQEFLDQNVIRTYIDPVHGVKVKVMAPVNPDNPDNPAPKA